MKTTRRSWVEDERAIYRLIFWLAVAALAVCLYATYEQWRAVTVRVGEAGNCPLYHEAYALAEIVPDDDGGVWCVYRGAW